LVVRVEAEAKANVEVYQGWWYNLPNSN